MTKPFDPSKPVLTRDGRPARILTTDRRGHCPIVALVGEFDDIFTYRANGASSTHGPQPLDLVNIPVQREGWINICRSPRGRNSLVHGYVYASRAIADEEAECDSRVACVRIEWDEPE